jgi:hypothetical protein
MQVSVQWLLVVVFFCHADITFVHRYKAGVVEAFLVFLTTPS